MIAFTNLLLKNTISDSENPGILFPSVPLPPSHIFRLGFFFFFLPFSFLSYQPFPLLVLTRIFLAKTYVFLLVILACLLFTTTFPSWFFWGSVAPESVAFSYPFSVICSWIFLSVCIPIRMIYDFFGPSPQVTVPSFYVLGSWPPFTFLKLPPNIAIIWPILQLTVWLRRLSEPSAPDSAAWMDPREHCSTHQRSPATLS